MIVGKENMNREEENRNQIITVHEFLESYRRYLDEDPALSGKTPATYSYLIEKHLIHDLGEYQLEVILMNTCLGIDAAVAAAAPMYR